MAIFENIDMDFLEYIDINKGILQNIDIDKISYRLEFGISNRAITLGLGWVSIKVVSTHKIKTVFKGTFWNM